MRKKFIAKHFYILTILFIFFAAPGYAIQPIKYLGIEHGLSNNAVTCIYRDHYGFMWMGTYDGLNRYDGDKFKIFRNKWGDSVSLANNHVNALTETNNKILIGTQKGLEYYDYLSGGFSPLYLSPLQGKKGQKINGNINALLTNKTGRVYIATENIGLLIYNGSGNICKPVTFNNKNKSTYNVQALAAGNNTRIWVFIKNAGLGWLDPQKNEINIVNSEIQSATCLLETIDGNIFIGTENGLLIYNEKKNLLSKFEQIYDRLTSNNIADIKLDKQENLWIATNGEGINIFNLNTHTISYLRTGKEQGTLRSGAISEIYIDNESRKWIATLRGGVNIIDQTNRPFNLYTHDPFNKNSVINNFIISFCEDSLHNIWIGTDGGGLSIWNRRTNQYVSYINTTAPNSLSSNFVVSILEDYRKKIWVATFSGGIDAFDKNTNGFKHYHCYNPGIHSEDKNLWKLYEDSHHNLWAGSTRGGALYLYNPGKDKFELFNEHLTNIHTLFEDNSGTLWAGNYTQLIKIDPVHKSYKLFNIGFAIRAIAQNKTHQIWLGTDDGGLLNFNTITNTFKRYTEINGLPGNTILNILVDNKKNVWCSTYNGITEYLPGSGKFVNYDVSDGLQSNQFNYNAALKLKSGEMLFGGINGFNLFNPDSIKIPVHQPELRLTDLKINNVITEGSNSFTHGQPTVSLKEIILPFNQATLDVEYTALEYSFPDKINYAYYLDGWDHGWNYVGKLKTANYNRLSEGSYTLNIKATNTEGSWQSRQLIIKVIVLPPWYRTWWAYLIYLLVTGTIIYSFWLYRIRQAKLKLEIEFANLRVEREKELNEKKLSFFTNVSHEFRTPLTLIINPIKDLLKQNNSNQEELSVIYRNARRLLGLVDHLLLFRKAESENTRLKVSKVNFINLCHDVFLCFTQQAKIKDLNYTLDSNIDEIEVYIDAEKIEIALFNLISNAIKFTPDGGNINIRIEQDDESVYFKIADNGIGISTDVGDKLFDKFYQDREKNYFKIGFGIGLYLVKIFIENHKGGINYHNNPNGGTTFVLSLPLGRQHFTDDQISEDSKFYITHVNELIDYDNNESAKGEKETKNLELMISNRQSVLVIDDNSEMRGYLKKLLAPDYTVFECDNAQKGLELIKLHLPDLIISDIVMPDISGLELCKLVKQDSATNHIPIILLTGDSTPDIMLRSIDEGAADFLSKPFEKDVLMARVKSVLRGKTELQNYFYKEITLKNSTRNISEEHKDFLYNCIAVVEEHLTDDHFDVYKLAKIVGMSYPTLFNRIKIITGQSINNFIRFIRLRKAAELLIHTNCNVNEAAYKVGFNDLKYFREHFNKQFGINPSDFIKKHRANFQISYRMNKIS